MKIKTIIITGMTVFALLVGAFLGVTSLVSAQSAEPTASQNGGAENLESVAEALGVTVEELQTALQNARPAECAEFKRGEKPEGVDCRPDFDAVATELGLTTEQVESAFKTAREQAQTERLTSAAETLGVTVEALQTALQNARPAECVGLERGEKPEGVDCRPNFESVATELGVTVEELQSAMGRGDKGERGGNLDAVAETLSVTTEALQQALQDARPAECAEFERGEKPEGVDCRPDFESAAETLGVDAEELKIALKNERGGRHGQGENNDERERP